MNIQAEGIYIDCTFGRGGHSRGILKKLGNKGRLLAFDRDQEAINSAAAREMTGDSRFSLHHNSFSELARIIHQYGFQGSVDGVLMDLGVSSPQLDNPERGFSFLKEGPLDMRMDSDLQLTAADWLQQVSEQALIKVLFEYGEERFARRIAHAVVEQRKQQSLQTTVEFAQLIEQVVPYREKHKHPATRSFQAVRIKINNELAEIEQGLKQATEILSPGGRLVVIAFHSLEDRIVKRFIRHESGRKVNPGRIPVQEKNIERGCLKKMGKAIRAGSEELRQNPRARSAIMRVAEKLKYES